MAVRWAFPPTEQGFADGAAAATAALVDVTPGTQPILIPPIWEHGLRLRIEAHGNLTTGTTGNAVTLGFYLAPPATLIGSATTIWVSASITSVVSLTNAPWRMKFKGECRALSTPASATAGSISGRGYVLMPASLSQFQAPYALPGTHAARAEAFNSTLQQNVMVGCNWAAITGSPTLTCEAVTVELIG